MAGKAVVAGNEERGEKENKRENEEGEERKEKEKKGRIRREKREKRRRMGFEEERRKETVNERMKIKAIFFTNNGRVAERKKCILLGDLPVICRNSIFINISYSLSFYLSFFLFFSIFCLHFTSFYHLLFLTCVFLRQTPMLRFLRVLKY